MAGDNVIATTYPPTIHSARRLMAFMRLSLTMAETLRPDYSGGRPGPVISPETSRARARECLIINDFRQRRPTTPDRKSVRQPRSPRRFRKKNDPPPVVFALPETDDALIEPEHTLGQPCQNTGRTQLPASDAVHASSGHRNIR